MPTDIIIDAQAIIMKGEIGNIRMLHGALIGNFRDLIIIIYLLWVCQLPQFR